MYDDVSFGTKKAAVAVDDDDDDSYPTTDEKIGTVAGTSTSNDSGIATGSLHVEVVRCADLQKPKVGTLYKAKMSGERVTPKVSRDSVYRCLYHHHPLRPAKAAKSRVRHGVCF